MCCLSYKMIETGGFEVSCEMLGKATPGSYHPIFGVHCEFGGHDRIGILWSNCRNGFDARSSNFGKFL